MSSSPPRSSSPSDFLSNELHDSLAEQQFGIRAFTILPTATTLEAKAAVTLLDGAQLQIALTSRGYMIDSGLERKSATAFETLEGLLAAASALYEQKRTELLFSKLQNI